MQAVTDQVKPAGKWMFDADVTSAFDDMLQRSIPAHDQMRQLVFELGCPFVREAMRDAAPTVLDLGCSRGAALAPFNEEFGLSAYCIGLDESAPMVAAARERFEGAIVTDMMDIRHHDLRDGLPDDVYPALTLAVLTLQFVPIEYRQRLVADVYRQTVPGGAMIVVEKILGPDAVADARLVKSYYRLKSANGYSPDQITAKRRSLEGVLVPQTAAANVAMLEAEGFRVSQFWQHLNFAGWLAVKPEGNN